MLSMNQDLIQAFSANYILENLGIALIYRPKRGVIKDGQGIRDYYEVECADIGFRTEDYTFVSLMEHVGEELDFQNNFDGKRFVMDFKYIEELCEEYDNYKPEEFLKRFEKKVGKCYLWNFKDKAFKEIKNKAFLKSKNKMKKTENDVNIVKMYDQVKETIIAQDEQIKQILASVYKNQKIINSSLDDRTIAKLKENIIVYGPTGTGKTEILTQIAKLCNVPIVIEDATSFSETGYVGRDVSEMLNDLYSMAGNDIHLAEKGILVIDEFDKLGESGAEGALEGPSRNGVQRSLLKLLDGGTLTFREDDYDGDLIEFNTSRLTVVALGAFSGIKKNDDYSDVSTKDFIDQGIMREVMGRFSKLVPMNNFSKEDYKRILLESKLSPIITYQKLFKEMGIKFSYNAELIDYLVEEAEALDCGARSLKTVFDGIISDELFDVFSGDKKEIHLKAPKDQSKSYVAKKRAAENRKRVGFH